MTLSNQSERKLKSIHSKKIESHHQSFSCCFRFKEGLVSGRFSGLGNRDILLATAL